MSDERTAMTRRRVVHSAVIGLSLGAVSTPVLGRSDDARSAGGPSSNGGGARGHASKGTGGNGRTPLVDGPAEFQVFVGRGGDAADDPNESGDFNYPEGPTLAGEDPVGGIFDAGVIEKTPNGDVLHHVFEFFQGLLIERDRGKPYVLRHEGDGRFTSRGQHINFEARTGTELRAALEDAGLDPSLAGQDPLATLAGGTWRGVGADVVRFIGDPAESRRLAWSLTRVDWYRRGSGRPTHELSALYAIYPNVDENGSPEPVNPRGPKIRDMPADTREAGRELIESGRRNPGGQ